MEQQSQNASPELQAEQADQIDQVPEPASFDEGVGLGVDIVRIDRMRAVLERSPRFRTRVFTEGERAYCDKTNQPEVHYATRFAAKEAVLKALGTGFSKGIAPADVEVVRLKTGRPQVRLHRRAKEVADELGVRELPISLSFTHTDAVACAMAITLESDRATARRTDPMDELAKQFKETRSLLDDIPVKRPKTRMTPFGRQAVAQDDSGEGDA